jgi:hypothetical protein
MYFRVLHSPKNWLIIQETQTNQIMKPLRIIGPVIAAFFISLFLSGCATSETEATAEEEAAATGSTSESEAGPRAKTAYEGSTGSGLLMERYKSGNIDGYRD